MNLSNVVIILCRPEESRNVGAVCRAMANNNIGILRIVGKKTDFDEKKVRTLAIHAASIWENAEFFDSISGAAEDCVICAGTTRRRGKKRGKLLLPEEFCGSADTISESGKIAVVFGNERTGLEEDELDECTMGVTIPSSPEFGSLNLSHAVQIISYHLYRRSFAEGKKLSPGSEPISLERLSKTVAKISGNLQKIGFFKVAGKEDMSKFWTDVLSRAALSEGEAAYIEKIFDKAAGLARKSTDECDEAQ